MNERKGSGKETQAEMDARKADRGERTFLLEDLYPEPAQLFKPYAVPPSSDKDVLVAFDTNALLLPYNIKQRKLVALGDVYRRLANQNRLFLPARAAREFIKLRDRKLAEMLQALNAEKSKFVQPDAWLSPLLDDIDEHNELSSAATAIREQAKKHHTALTKLVAKIKSWRGNDPITCIYAEVSKQTCIVEHDGSSAEVEKEWEARLQDKIPPGYKDAGKAAQGIGDFLIWKSLLLLGAAHGKDLIFITGEQKADWFVRAGEEPIYPRPELVHEYRRAPNGRNIRFASLHELLSEMHAPEDIVSEVKEVEATQARAFHVSAPEPKFYFHFRQTTMKTFNYSTNDGELTIDDFGRIFTLKFSKASDTSIHLVRTDNLRRIARIKNTRPNDVVDPDQHDSSSRVYTIQLVARR